MNKPTSFLAASLISLVSMAGSVPTARADHPPAISDLSLEDATKQVENTDRVLVIKFTAEWCAPCKIMDRTTLRDQQVIDWIKSNGVMIEIDADKKPELVQKFGVSGFPTMIIQRNGSEIARRPGYIDAKRFLVWLESAKSGKAPPLVRVDRASKDMVTQLQVARDLVMLGRVDAAAEDFAWLWENMAKVQPDLIGARLTAVAGDMQAIAMRDEGALKAFSKLRDDLEPSVRSGSVDRNALIDWVVLNNVVADQERTLEWIEQMLLRPDASVQLEPVAFLIADPLIARRRFADLAQVHANPATAMARDYAIAAEYFAAAKAQGQQPDESTLQQLRNQFRTKWACIYAGTLSLNKDDAAADIARQMIQTDDTPDTRFALVSAAVEIKQARPQHRQWLEEIEATGANLSQLRMKLENALSDKKPAAAPTPEPAPAPAPSPR